MRSMEWQLGILGTISAFAYRRRETIGHDTEGVTGEVYVFRPCQNGVPVIVSTE